MAFHQLTCKCSCSIWFTILPWWTWSSPDPRRDNRLRNRRIHIKEWDDMAISTISVDLKRWRPLSFVDDMDVPKSVYCVVVDIRSILNNQHSLKAVLTPDTKFAASFFGPQNEGAAVGGPYAGVHKLLDLEDRMKQECLRVYENYSISVDWLSQTAQTESRRCSYRQDG